MNTGSTRHSGRIVLTAMRLCRVPHRVGVQASVASAPFSRDTRWFTFMSPALQEPKTSDRIASSLLQSLVSSSRREPVVDEEIARATLSMLVVRALTSDGRSDVLYDLLSLTGKQSYGDQVRREPRLSLRCGM
jgi:hypothetical protein